MHGEPRGCSEASPIWEMRAAWSTCRPHGYPPRRCRAVMLQTLAPGGQKTPAPKWSTATPPALRTPRTPSPLCALGTPNTTGTGSPGSLRDPRPRTPPLGACPHLRPPLCRPPARWIIFKLTAECAPLILTSPDKPPGGQERRRHQRRHRPAGTGTGTCPCVTGMSEPWPWLQRAQDTGTRPQVWAAHYQALSASTSCPADPRDPPTPLPSPRQAEPPH